jgi:exosome complex component RRP43
MEVNIGSLTHCNGSSLVKTGATSIVCGVRAEILPVTDIPSFRISKSTASSDGSEKEEAELSHYNLLVPNLELSTGCSSLHPANTAPSTEAQSISQRILSLLLTSKLIRLSDLEIYHTPDPTTSIDGQEQEPQLKAYWTLYIDMLCISYAGSGSVFDCAWLALYAALKDTILPEATWDIDDMTIYCSPDIKQARRLSLRGMPVPLSFGIFEGKLLVDLDTMEEECCEEKGSVTVDETTILRIEKSGGGAMGGKEMVEVLGLAQNRWTEWKKICGD